ncbi:VWA domain-containing protein [Frigidibacter sp. ROC022]|uniref:VWA domain-containing protein n=1 Tax=Frigidibacter sp. ROC022 TaxID=2971796 RepID=UPI00215A96A1|nr:VWA domain-containing protein [Frigidibacter sp. ROC022]MCR8723564.1 VWA domain-containing protein [Frigidibacter sp. ROC022]
MFLSRLAACLMACLVGLTAAPTLAQDRADTILVLDGSGSMWGQIDGVAKITIAQKVVADLLDNLPADQNLGLTVYGHRRKGDCSDIETVVAPGPDTRAAIRAAVEAIKPKGKTPMTDSVIAAAEALKFTENAATVILVSDGIETCNPDPCAAAKILEETGVNFTAHVVGFDVAGDVTAMAQMRCIAEETGGKFLTAEDAATLADALTEVAAAPPEPVAPQPVTVSFEAHVASETGPLIGDGLIWTVTGPEGAVIENDGSDADPQLQLLPGDYTVSVLRLADEATAEASFRPGTVPMTVRLVLPELLPQATISGPAEAPIGATIKVEWTADPDTDGGDYISVAALDREDYEYANYRHAAEGAPTDLIMPLIPGQYELRYVASITGRGDIVLARAPITVTDLAVTLDAAASGGAGSAFKVGFDGPDYPSDYISVAKPGETAGTYVTYTYTRNGNPLELTLPLEAGEYELRYVAHGSPDRVLASQPLTVTDISATLEAPDSAGAGSRVKVTWTGPGNQNDYISVSKTDSEPWQYEAYTFTRHGNPAVVTMPLDPGTYELRYVANGSPDRVIGTRPITVVEVGATLEAPEEVGAGSEVKVIWDGPDNQNDYISVAKTDADAGSYEHYSYTRHGSPAKVKMPLTPGTYELRYVANGSPDKVLATRPITVVEVGATLEAPEEVGAGSEVKVIWDGPDNQNDYISVAKTDADAGSYEYYSNTRHGSPAKMKMPLTPGTYELRYVANGSPDKVLATRPITVVEVGATLEAPEEVGAGSEVKVIWDGPANRDDYISVAKPDADAGSYENYAYTRNGSPAKVTMPLTPGTYELRYVAQGRPDKVLASRPISVVEVGATLEAPETVIAGSEVKIAWTGPGNRNDFVSVASPGEDPNKYENYAYTRNGSPAKVTMPLTPGTYELRYVAQGRPDKVLASRKIEVVAAEVSLSAPTEAVAGETIQVTWSGPDNRNDFIAVSLPGADPNDYFSYTYSRQGSPLPLLMPVEAGTYEIRYVGQGKPDQVLASRTITLSPLSASLTAPATVKLGEKLMVEWEGPNYANDYIAVAVPGSDKKLTFAYTRNGQPLAVPLPKEPGSYELRYVLGQGRGVIATRPLTVE